MIWRGERFDPLNLHGSHCVQCVCKYRSVHKERCRESRNSKDIQSIN